MKVVLFCGGLGMRIREASEKIPKPMVEVGDRPILWHIMKYYAHFGHTDFVLCLGYRSEVIKNYFVNYAAFSSSDCVLSNGGRNLQILNSDINDWTITFVDTGITSNIGQRLNAAERYLGDDDTFLANYSDNLTDFHLPDLVEEFHRRNKVAAFLCVRPTLSCHCVSIGNDGLVQDIRSIGESSMRINGGYFVFKRSIFEHIKHGEELVQEPFRRLIETGNLLGYAYDGFWKSMDTFKEKQELDDLANNGRASWQVWRFARNESNGIGLRGETVMASSA